MFIIELFEILDDRVKLCGILGIYIEELAESNAQVVADIDNAIERRIGFTCFDIIDITGILTDGKAHISCRNTFLCAELRDAQSNIFLFHNIYHLLSYVFYYIVAYTCGKNICRKMLFLLKYRLTDDIIVINIGNKPISILTTAIHTGRFALWR